MFIRYGAMDAHIFGQSFKTVNMMIVGRRAFRIIESYVRERIRASCFSAHVA